MLAQCHEDGFVAPVLEKAPYDSDDKPAKLPPGEETDAFEGAIVLDPICDIYIDDPVSVLDYASLYPSSMISENLSHDCLVIDQRYASLPGVEYNEIKYDMFDSTKAVIGEKTCRYAVTRQGLIPRTLEKLLGARKQTRARMTHKKVQFANGMIAIGKLSGCTLVTEQAGTIKLSDAELKTAKDAYDDFQKAVLDGLQNAYKVTANSLYGQMGAKTSQLYLKELAACTTATGPSIRFYLRCRASKTGTKIPWGRGFVGL